MERLSKENTLVKSSLLILASKLVAVYQGKHISFTVPSKEKRTYLHG